MPAPAHTDAAPPPALKLDKSSPAAEPPAVARPSASGLHAWLPLVVAIVAGPILTWATVEFVLVPRLKAKLAMPPPPTAPAAAAEAAPADKAVQSRYEFSSVIVNLAGTMGTRYLKTSFIVVGDPASGIDVKQVFTENHPKLYDTTLNVLSSLTLADLEETGAKNVIREKLVSAYNQALGKRVAEQVYFSDFVVQ